MTKKLRCQSGDELPEVWGASGIGVRHAYGENDVRTGTAYGALSRLDRDRVQCQSQEDNGVVVMNNKPLYIFDLDGTLALIDHRRPLLDNKSNPHRWRDFYAACVHDEPNGPVIDIMHCLLDCHYPEVWIWSGRSDEVIEDTHRWLDDRAELAYRKYQLKMRKKGDSTPDQDLKQSWLLALSADDRARLRGVFDDRDKVVAMWRRNNVPCFQVAPGDF